MKNKMLLKDISDAVADKLGLNKEDSYLVGSEIFATILEALSQNKSVMIFEFGLFSNKATKGRDLSSLTGKKNIIENYMLPKFTFSKKIRSNLKTMVNHENN